MKIRILYASDFHLKGEEETVDSFNQNQVTGSLVEFAGELAKIGPPFDLVAITKDLAFRADPAEYAAAAKMCEDLLAALSLDESRLFVVPGNHDVDQGKIDPLFLENLYSFNSQLDILKRVGHEAFRKNLKEKLSAFDCFAWNVSGKPHCDAGRFHYTEKLRIEKDGESILINILGLNSALFAGYNGDDKQKLALGLFQVDAALKEAEKSADLSIALLHHPFPCFDKCEKVSRNRLVGGADLILTGHVHEEENVQQKDAAGDAVLIGAGASFATRQWRNSFGVLDIDLDVGRGRVRFYEYVADHNTYVPSSRVNPRAKTADGAFEFDVPLRGKPGGGASVQKRTSGKESETSPAGDGGREARPSGKKERTVVDPKRKKALIRAYLNRAIRETESLALRGIDPKAAGLRHGGPLRLGAVYTALMVKAGDAEGADIMGARKRRGPLSALALLDRHRHLVLLGDPGSGKSTFVNFVAMCLAGEGLGKNDVNVGLMTAPPPDEKGEDSDKPQPWTHGALLPLRVVLRDLVAWEGFSKRKGGGSSSEDVWNFVLHRLDEASQIDCAQVLKDELLENGGIVLFDGLDEVPDSEAKRERIKRAVENFAASFPECRILVTSRTYAYQSRKWKIEIPGVAVAELAAFTRGQVYRFIDNWHAHVPGRREWTPKMPKLTRNAFAGPCSTIPTSTD